MVPFLTTGIGELNIGMGTSRTGSAPCMRGVVPVKVPTKQFNYHPGHHPVL